MARTPLRAKMNVFELCENVENVCGYLRKYISILTGWKRRFFILCPKERVLYEFDNIEGNIVFPVHSTYLNGVTVILSNLCDTKLSLIHSSGYEVQLESDTKLNRDRWVTQILSVIEEDKVKIAQDMQVNVAGLRRNLKNIAHNYSEAQVKVRKATSNDPWGPNSTLMAEIAELTYNVVAFSEIMQMIWKRLNDHGRNWRHVYKALILLEYVIKTGTEKVAQQCKENIFAIQTLNDFQYMEEGKDQGINVREKAKQLVALLKDAEKLKNERIKALKAKERFAQSGSGFGSDDGQDVKDSVTSIRNNWSDSSSSGKSANGLETARPQTAGEEELQLQLALAMSREEADQDELKRKSDDIRLQMALSESQHDLKKKVSPSSDLLDLNLSETLCDTWSIPPPKPVETKNGFDHWQKPPMSAIVTSTTALTATAVTASTSAYSPFSMNGINNVNNRGAKLSSPPPLLPQPALISSNTDPWQIVNEVSVSNHPGSSHNNALLSLISQEKQNGKIEEDFDLLSKTATPDSTFLNSLNIGGGSSSRNTNNNDPFDLSLLNISGMSSGSEGKSLARPQHQNQNGRNMSPHGFLGENYGLVNLDSLLTTPPAQPVSSKAVNPFVEIQAPPPTINQLKQQQTVPLSFQSRPQAPLLPLTSSQYPQSVPEPLSTIDPWAPVINHTQNNQQTNATVWNTPFSLDDKPNPFLT